MSKEKLSLSKISETKEAVYKAGKRETVETREIEIDPDFWRQLQIIAAVVGGDFGMKIEIGEPGKGSFFNSLENKIKLDPIHLKKNPELAQFVVAHEGGHRAITRGPHEIGLKKEKIKEIYSQLGFAYGQNCLEDPADNNWFGRKFEKLKDITKNIYDKMLEKENIPLGLEHDEVRIATRMIGYIPRFVFFGSEIIRYWHQNRFSRELDPKIKESLEKVKDFAVKYFETIPSTDGKSEEETLEKARERFLIFYQNIWPEMQKIVRLDIDDEKIRKMVEKMMEDVLKELEDKSKEELEKMVKEGKLRFDEEMEKNKERLKNTQKEGEKLDQEIKDLKKKIEEAKVEEKEELVKKLNEKEGEKNRNQERQKELEQELQEMKEQKEKGGLPLPMDKMSPELKKKLQEIFDKLSEKQKEQLEEEAKESLEELEDKLNEEIEGKLNQDNVESHKERKERIKKEEEEAKKKRKEEEEIEKAREKIQRKIEKEMSEYDKYYQKVKPIIEALYNELQKIFLPQRHPRWKKGYPSGGRLDLLKAMQFEADKSKYTEIWERKTIPRKIDYRFTFLVDLSGSMEGRKIEETFKGMIVLAEVLNRIGIKFNIIGFQDKPIIFKNFSEELDRSKRNLLSGMLAEPCNQNPGGNNRAEWNSDGYCLEQAAKELEKNKAKDNFLIVLSDGLPVPDPAHAGKEYDLSYIVNKIRKKTNIKLVGLGLGPDTEHVQKYYPNHLANITVEQLPSLLSQLLEDMIKYPEKY